MKTKKTFMTALIVVAVLLVGVVAAGLIWFFFFSDDYFNNEWLRFCKGVYPLDEDHAYVIYQNYGDDKFSDGSIYIFTPYNQRGKSTEDNRILCRQVGSETTLDLTPYLGQPVTITGDFYYGDYLINPASGGDYNTNGSREVLRIDSLNLAESPQEWDSPNIKAPPNIGIEN